MSNNDVHGVYPVLTSIKTESIKFGDVIFLIEPGTLIAFKFDRYKNQYNLLAIPSQEILYADRNRGVILTELQKRLKGERFVHIKQDRTYV